MGDVLKTIGGVFLVPLLIVFYVAMWVLPSAITVLIGLAVLDLVGVINLGWF